MCVPEPEDPRTSPGPSPEREDSGNSGEGVGEKRRRRRHYSHVGLLVFFPVMLVASAEAKRQTGSTRGSSVDRSCSPRLSKQRKSWCYRKSTVLVSGSRRWCPRFRCWCQRSRCWCPGFHCRCLKSRRSVSTPAAHQRRNSGNDGVLFLHR